MNTVVIVQARMGSTRLPGKVMLDLGGKPVLQHVVERARAAGVGPVVVATGAHPRNNPIGEWCGASGTMCVAIEGDEGDVFGRFRAVVEPLQARAFARVTSDCVLLEPDVLRALVERMEHAGLDYIDGTHRAGFCEGIGAEIVRTRPFMEIVPETLTPEEREHVSVGLPGRWGDRCGMLEPPDDLRRPYKLSLDTREDYERLRAIFAALGPDPDTREVLRWLDGWPELRGRAER